MERIGWYYAKKLDEYFYTIIIPTNILIKNHNRVAISPPLHLEDSRVQILVHRSERDISWYNFSFKKMLMSQAVIILTLFLGMPASNDGQDIFYSE
jgi:hypothetical protein